MQSLVGSPTVTSLMTCAPVAALMRAPISQSTTHEERRHGLPDSPALTPPDEKCRLEEVLCQETLLLESKNPTEAASPAAASEFLLTTRVSELEQALTSSMRENVSAVAARRDAEMTIARLETALAAERLRADSMEAENLRLKQEAEEAETNRQVSALWDVIPPTPTLGDVSSRRSRRSSTLSRGLCTPARAVAISPAASEGFCETPSWLREADGFAQSDADEANAAMARAAAAMAAEAEAKAAADEKGRAAAEAEEAAEKAAVAAAEAAARTAAALAAASTAEAARTAAEEQRAQMQAKAEASLSAKARELAAACIEREQATATAAELKARCATLEAEKSALVAELAKTAGHLNHKQKIHYLSQLKNENDDLRMQLKEARAAGFQGCPGGGSRQSLVRGGKENRTRVKR